MQDAGSPPENVPTSAILTLTCARPPGTTSNFSASASPATARLLRPFDDDQARVVCSLVLGEDRLLPTTEGAPAPTRRTLTGSRRARVVGAGLRACSSACGGSAPTIACQRRRRRSSTRSRPRERRGRHEEATIAAHLRGDEEDGHEGGLFEHERPGEPRLLVVEATDDGVADGAREARRRAGTGSLFVRRRRRRKGSLLRRPCATRGPCGRPTSRPGPRGRRPRRRAGSSCLSGAEAGGATLRKR